MTSSNSTRSKRRWTWLLWLAAVGLFFAEQNWQRQAESAALTQAHQRIQLGDSAEQACQVLQAVRLITVLPGKQDRCKYMALTGSTVSGNWRLIIRTQNGLVSGKAMRDLDSWVVPCTAPPDEGHVEPPTRQVICN